MSIATRYEVAYTAGQAGPTTILGFIARHSASGLLAFVQGNTLAQRLVEELPDNIQVDRQHLAWAVSLPGAAAPIGRFHFTGRTQREADGPGLAGAALLRGRVVAR